MTTADGNSPISTERTLVATLVHAASRDDTVTVDAILESVAAADLADEACEQIFIIAKQLVESQAPVSRAVVETADAPPGIPGRSS